MVAEVFHSVLTSSLHAAVVGLVILLLKAALKNRLNAQWHYLIWIVLILKLIMPFGPASAVSLFNIIPEVNPPERMIVDTYQVPAPIAAPPVTADKSTEIQPAPVVFPAEQVTPGIEFWPGSGF